MERRLAALRAEVSAPERNKFTAPILLVHGLWSGSWMWHGVAGALAQRGWECWALDLRGRTGSRPVETISTVHLEDYIADVIAAARALWAPPVLCGHGLGALLALLAAAQIGPRALVGLAPLLPCAWVPDERLPLPLMRLSTVPALLWKWPLHPPPVRMSQEFLFTGLSAAEQAQLHGRLQADSGTVAYTLTRGRVGFPAGDPPFCPQLILSGRRDRMQSPTSVRWLVTRLQAEHQEYVEEGHWLVAGARWLSLVADVHRWLIRSLGESLLVPLEEE
jgi:pimeloyl-ACP methyl ester carboxylesterase